MYDKRCTLNDVDLMSKCLDWISKLCATGGNAWVLRVPVDFINDPDILFNELISRFHASKASEAAKLVGVDAVINPQQLKQAIALVRAAAKRDLYNNENGLGFDFCLNIIEQRACV